MRLPLFGISVSLASFVLLPLAQAMLLQGGIQHTQATPPPPPTPGRLGFELEITPHDYPRVIAVFAGLPAQQAGLAVGDKLLAADNQSLLTLPLPAVDAAISDEVGRIVTLRVKKPSQPQLLTIKVKVAP